MKNTLMSCAANRLQSTEPQAENGQLFNINVHDNATINIAYLSNQTPIDSLTKGSCQNLMENNCAAAPCVEDCDTTAGSTSWDHPVQQDTYTCTATYVDTQSSGNDLTEPLYLHLEHSDLSFMSI